MILHLIYDHIHATWNFFSEYMINQKYQVAHPILKDKFYFLFLSVHTH